MVEQDLHDVYGIDASHPLVRRRSWRWFCSRVAGLLNRPPIYAPDGSPIFTTRIQQAVFGRQEAPPREAESA